MSAQTVNEIRKQGERFLKALYGELYSNLSGLKKDINTRSIYKSYPDLGEPDLYFSLKNISPANKEEGNVDITCSVHLLLNFLARSFIGSKTARLVDEIMTTEVGESIGVERTAIPFRSARAEMKKEPKRARREEIERKRREVVLKLNPLFLELYDNAHNSAGELGFSSYEGLCDEIEELNLTQLEEKAKTFLNDTEYIYRDFLSWFLSKKMELKLKDAKSYDLDYLFNSFELRTNFPETNLRAIAESILGEMDVETGEKIKSDIEPRRGKTSEPFCMPIEPPRSITFSIHPVGGVEDYESFFYGLGSALCYGQVEDGDDFEFKHLRESTTVEIYAYLFNNLIYQPKWLKKYLKAELHIDFIRFLYLRHLTKIRYYAGKLIYEMALHKDEDFKTKSDLYKQMLQNALFCEQDEVYYLIDVKPYLYTASCLKGIVIEASFRNYLRENFDEQWWREKEAGNFIRKIWREGGRIGSHEISRRLGINPFDLSPLMASFREVLG